MSSLEGRQSLSTSFSTIIMNISQVIAKLDLDDTEKGNLLGYFTRHPNQGEIAANLLPILSEETRSSYLRSFLVLATPLPPAQVAQVAPQGMLLRHPRSPSPELDANAKRAKTFEKRNDCISKFLATPSTYAGSAYDHYNQHTIQDLEIRHHRPMSLSDIPVRFYCQIFEKFRSLFDNSEVEEKDVNFIRQLADQISTLDSSEKNRERLIRKFLEYFLRDLQPPLNMENLTDPFRAGGYTSDGTSLKRVTGTSFLALNLEVNSDYGTMHCSYLQNAAYYVTINRSLWAANEQYSEKTSYPTFLLTLDGTQLTISGAVLSDYVCIDKLTPAIHLDMAFYDGPTAVMAARAIRALMSCLQDLQDHYNDLHQGNATPTTFSNGPYPRFPLEDKHTLQNFRYIMRLGTKNLWIAEAGNEEVVVKFTRRYCREAHEACSHMGIAPKLFYYEELDDNWHLVIMEYLDGYHQLDKFLDNLLDDQRLAIKDNVINLVNRLHNIGFVHGDLRGPNILVKSESELKLIDFDWAGRDGHTKYPESLNPNISWHKDAGLNENIYATHDNHLVDWVLKGSKEVKCRNLCIWNRDYGL